MDFCVSMGRVALQTLPIAASPVTQERGCSWCWWGGEWTDLVLRPPAVLPLSVLLSAGELPFHWNSWQPWVCMCDLHKQGRIRHFVVWGKNISLDMKSDDFWQERACSLEDCSTCTPDECPDQTQKSGFFPQILNPWLSSKPVTLKIPLPTHLLFPSYDNLPLVDDAGEN